MSAATPLVEFPPCHKARSAPSQLYQEFEALFLAHPTISTPHRVFNHMLFEERINTKANPKWRESRFDEYAELKRMLWELQLKVSYKAARFLRHENLKKKWLSGSVDFREKHALVGIAGACSISPNLSRALISCVRELCVSYLANNPQNYLNLLEEIAPHDLSETPVEPHYVSDPEWDCFQADHRDDSDELHKFAVGYILVLRNKLIAHTLEFIANSVLDMPLPMISVYKTSHSSEKAMKKNPDAFQLLQKDAMICTYGKESYEEISAEFDAAYKERKAGKVSGCRHCDKMERMREAFKKCAVCAKMGREVLYCSKECQVADWKIEHKKICGKQLDYDTADKLSHTVRKPKDPSGFPPPAPSFKRPLPLLSQINRLKDNPTFEYAVTRSVFQNNEDTAMITFTPSPIQPRFRAHRDCAIHDGNRRSVALMCECILWYIEVCNSQDIKRESVLNQVSAEYGWTVDALEDALAVLARVRAGRPERRPALWYSDCV